MKLRLLWFALLAAGIAAAALLLIESGAWASLARLLRPGALADLAGVLRGLGVWTPLASLLLMTAQAVIAPLPGNVIAAANGLLYGPWLGSLLSWAGGMAGAVVTYWLGKALRRIVVLRLRGSAPDRLLSHLATERGFWIVLVARLTPFLSLDAVGYVAGLASMPLGPYLLANALGMAPGMVIYTILGSDLAAARFSAWRLGGLSLALLALAAAGRWWWSRLAPAEAARSGGNEQE